MQNPFLHRNTLNYFQYVKFQIMLELVKNVNYIENSIFIFLVSETYFIEYNGK